MHHFKTWDQFFALLLLPIIIPILGVLFLIVVPLQGRPFFFASERMRDTEHAFYLLKLRTMDPLREGEVEKVLGAAEAQRITLVGEFLRKSRLDELPQIFNVLKGEIRFIGPRPPLRQYVEAMPDIYADLLRDMRPGITGLATVTLHEWEERILSRCKTDLEAHEVYYRRCLPVKARLDRIYRDNRSLSLNLLILWRTFSRLRVPLPRLPRLCVLTGRGLPTPQPG